MRKSLKILGSTFRFFFLIFCQYSVLSYQVRKYSYANFPLIRLSFIGNRAWAGITKISARMLVASVRRRVFVCRRRPRHILHISA